MTTPNRTTSRDLFDLIDAKESDLIRMRREASAAVLEELRIRDDRLAELRTDFEHNLKVLRERDQIIANLERTAGEANERQAREVATATKRAEERAASIEEECRSRERRIKDDYERRLSSEVDRRLAEREHSLREELAASAAAELSERERQISTAYERAAADREATCKRREGAADKRVQDMERSRAAHLKEAEDRWKATESELQDRLVRAERAKNEAESRLRENIAEADGVTSQRNRQMERMVRELKGLEQETARLREDNTRLEGVSVEKDGKISELLQALVDLEAGFLRQHGALQEERDALAQELESKCNDLEALHSGASQASSTYEKALTKLEKKLDKRKRQWAEKEMILIDKADNLRSELDKLKASSTKSGETAVRDLAAAKSTIGDLELRIAQLQEEGDRRKDELERAKQDLDAERRRSESLHQDHKEALSRSEDSRQAAVHEMQSKHQAELDSLQQEAIDDVRRALIDKNAISEEKKHLEKDIAKLKSKLSNCEQQLDEHQNCASTEDVERLKSENSRLQDTIDVLRSEIEASVGDASGGAQSREDELSRKIEELSDELDVVLADRRRLIDLSNKLRVDLQRLQSSSEQSTANGTAPFETVHDRVLSAQPLSLHNIVDMEGDRTTNKTTSQGTESQRQALARLRKKKEKQERIRVRNWNERDDR